MNRIVMIGASGHGKVCAEIASLSGQFNEILFLDDDPMVKECGIYDVCGPSSDFIKYLDEDTSFFVSIGKCETRERIQTTIERAGGNIGTLVHPQSVISKDIFIGVGTVIMAGVVINTGSVIGKGNIINTLSSVDHDCQIGDYCHVAVGAHICGTVKIGKTTWIGAGATVINNVTIENAVTVGAGATVIRDIKMSGTYVGIPTIKIH